jgi:hypothetical protein
MSIKFETDKDGTDAILPINPAGLLEIPRAQDSDENPNLYVAGTVCDGGCCFDVAFGIFTPSQFVGFKIELDDAIELGEWIISEAKRVMALKNQKEGTSQ